MTTPLTPLPPDDPDKLLAEQAYLVGNGVRPLALVDAPAPGAGAFELLGLLTRLEGLRGSPTAIPFVIGVGGGRFAAGYAAAQWAIDLLHFALTTAPLTQRHRILGLLLGYSADAIHRFEETASRRPPSLDEFSASPPAEPESPASTEVATGQVLADAFSASQQRVRELEGELRDLRALLKQRGEKLPPKDGKMKPRLDHAFAPAVFTTHVLNVLHNHRVETVDDLLAIDLGSHKVRFWRNAGAECRDQIRRAQFLLRSLRAAAPPATPSGAEGDAGDAAPPPVVPSACVEPG